MIGTVQQEIARQMRQIRTALLGRIKRSGSRVQVATIGEELIPEVRVFQQFGVASGLPLETEVVLLPLLGRTARMVVIASGGQPPVSLAEGEVCIYDRFGHHIHLRADGIHFTGDVFVDGVKVNGHTHSGKAATRPSERTGPMGGLL